MGSQQQLQDLQKMQIQQQLMQAQMQQQQAAGRQQMLSQNSSFGSLGGLSQMAPSGGGNFSNQQWMDQNQQLSGGGQQHRNSLTGMSNSAMAMMQQQQQQQNQGGAQNQMNANNNAQAALYWNVQNALQASNKGPTGGDSVGSNKHSMGGAGGKGNSSSNSGMMDNQMQALLQRQGMNNNHQVQQMRQQMGQQNFGNNSQHGRDQADLSNAMVQAANAVAGGNGQRNGSGGNSGLGGMMNNQQSGQGPNSGSSSEQLLLHQQKMIADLRRQLQQQQQNANAATNNMSQQNGMGGGRRSSSSSSNQQGNLLTGQQQAALMQQQQQQLGGSNSAGMLQQAMSSGMNSNGMQRQKGSGLQQQQKRRQPSMGGNDQAMLSSLMGSQSQQSQLGGNQSQMRRGSGNTPGSNSLLGDVFGGQSTGGSSGSNSMTQQQAQLDQLRSQQQQLLGGMNQLAPQDMQKAQQILMQQAQAKSRSSPSGLMIGSGSQNQQHSDGGDKSSTDAGKSSGKGKGKRRSNKSGKSKQNSASDDSDTAPQTQQSFLDGTFAGGWQSNQDLPDRRRIILNIVKVIEQMRPGANKMSHKLPMMAKRLEEHLYRSARAKEEYLDPATLKKRLRMIAHGLEAHRSSSSDKNDDAFGLNEPSDDKQQNTALSASQKKGMNLSENNGGGGSSGGQQQMLQHLQQIQQQQQQQQQQQDFGALEPFSINSQQGGGGQQLSQNDLLGQNNSQGMSQQGLSGMGETSGNLDPQSMAVAQLQENIRRAQAGNNNAGILKTGNAKYQQETSSVSQSQKKKVIRQQQQRLLLLRHASKCTAGPSCKTKFCAQMVTLWKHMKKCRDKNCKTAHCLSSRCVLNHYRICKSENKTSTCEVCAPVMRQIKWQNSQPGDDPMDNLNSDSLGDSTGPQPTSQGISNRSSPTPPPGQSNPDVAQQKRQQLEELQAAQQKLHQQQLLLKQLQQQQAQLLEQQKQLQQQQQNAHTPQQGQQLSEQQQLLQNLQRQFQQQQMLLQQELHRKSQSIQGVQSQQGVQVSPMDQAEGADSSKVKGKSQKRKTKRGGKGKRLSAVEANTGDSSMEIKSLMSNPQADLTSSSRKRSLEGLENSNELEEPDLKSAKIESSSSAANVPSSDEKTPDNTESSSKKEKLLDPGNFAHTTALIPSMTTAAIEQHLESLNDSLHLTPRTISQKCAPVLKRLLDDQYGWVFRDAVDPVVLNLPDYFDVVKKPMHLALVEKNVENAVYKDMESFERDTKLVFENAILYNGEESEVGQMAQIMLDRFDKENGAVLKAIKNEQQNLKKKGDACSLCGSQRRLFEPTVLYCNGACGMQRIRRNAFYYTDSTKLNHWCVPCYSALKDDEPVILDSGNEIKKTGLQKFKNDALPEEAWVQCDDCHNWVHQICALFNGRKNKTAATYTCPKCHIKKVADGKVDKPDHLAKSAKDIPHCKMSMAIEDGLHKALASAYEERASELGCIVDEVSKADGLTVRVVSNMEKNHVVRDEMYERYSKSGCPSGFPVRSKCILLFQKIHGVDVLLFGLYVYEYDQTCPAPNRRRVYISYLDSVHYFEPKYYRTITYHSILIEYLRYVKERGFHTAHIWSCPPMPGDDYVFYAHPQQQLIPRDDMLRQWYLDMLDKAEAQGVVIKTNTLYDEYFKNNGEDATAGHAIEPTSLPYFEGDYIPGEIENIIKELKTQEDTKDATPANRKVGKKKGTRSNPGDLVGVSQDKVMLRLGQALSNMRQNFMVVHLRNRRFASAVENGEDVTDWIDEDDEDVIRNKKMKISGKDSSILQPMTKSPKESTGGSEDKNAALDTTGKTGEKKETDDEIIEKPGDVDSTSVDKSGEKSVETETKSGKSDNDQSDGKSDGKKSGEVAKEDETDKTVSRDDGSLGTASVSCSPVREDNEETSDSLPADDSIDQAVRENLDSKQDADDDVKCDTEKQEADTSVPKSDSPVTTEAKNRDDAKRGFDEIEPTLCRAIKENSKPIGSTIDEDEQLESDIFESRQQFLNYCQTNHFQFDELRRAKHSTMMLLYQIHNPNAPKFLQQCGSCYREITHGTRYKCNDCSNFDLCEDCYEPVITGLWAQRDSRFAHDKNHSFTAINMEESSDKQRSREEQARALKAHLKLLAHAGSCGGPPSCTLKNCAKMKELFQHVQSCEVTFKKGCKKCQRLLSLMTMHARLCTNRGSCPIPFCDRIRERNKRLRQQQQLMDDRRRQAQNELYRGGQ